MRFFIFPPLIALLCSTAQAVVPYSELNKLRIQSIVTRIAADNPGQAWIKKCLPLDKALAAGSALSAAMDDASVGWKNLEITQTDVLGLKEKINICELRGSCHIYDTFLNSAQAGKALTKDILGMKEFLEKKLSSLTTKSFQRAFKEIQQPCTVLRVLVNR